MQKTYDLLINSKFIFGFRIVSTKNKLLNSLAGIGAHCAAALSPFILWASPTASFVSFSGTGLFSPPRQQPPPTPPKTITAWTQRVNPGDKFNIKASCYDDTGTTASGVPIEKDRQHPVVAVPQGTTDKIPHGTRLTVQRLNSKGVPTGDSVKAVVADTGNFGRRSDGTPNGYNTDTGMDLWIKPATVLGFSDCNTFGKKDARVTITYVPNTPADASYLDVLRITQESLASLGRDR